MKTRFYKKNTQHFDNLIRQCLNLRESQTVLAGNVISWSNALYYLYNQQSTGVDLCARNIIVNAMINARNAAPGSELLMLRMLKSNNISIIKTQRLSSDKAKEIAIKKISNARAKKIFHNATSILGSVGKIVVEESNKENDTINLVDGCQIPICIDSRFSERVKINSCKLDYANVLIIEGAPSSVSDLNKLLTECHETGIKLILLARSFPDEVISTLAINWIKNKLSVLPFVYGSGLENINSHSDISAISGAIPITPMFGDTLQLDYSERYGALGNIRVEPEKIICTPTKNPAPLISDLLTRAKKCETSEHEKAQYLYNRIAGLHSRVLHVSLKKSKNTFIVKDELDLAIPYYNMLCYNSAQIKIDNCIETVPYKVFTTATKLCQSLQQSINTIGGFLVASSK